MRLFHGLTILMLPAALCLSAQSQPTPRKEVTPEVAGVPPRAAPSDYQGQATTGGVTIAADFKGHAIPTSLGALQSEDFVTVELGIYGKPDTHLKISAEDFSLRINGKKAAIPSQPFGLAIASTKDPEWEPPEQPKAKSKSGVNTGGEQDDGPPPGPPKVPLGVQRTMAQRMQKAAIPEGDRVLPQGGVLYFPYRGRTPGIKSVELVYSGPAGKATLTLQP